VSVRRLLLAAAVALAGCAPSVSMSGPTGPIDERCQWTGRHQGPWVFQEQESIIAFFEATSLEEYRRVLPAIFAMPERPLVRVSVIDFYAMINGATYLESVVSVLGLHQGRAGFFHVTMPVTSGDSCAGGRSTFGYPKIVRRITLERRPHGYVGVLYAAGGLTPQFTLALDTARQPSGEALEVLRFVAPMPGFTMKDGRVFRFGGGARPAYELERASPTTWQVRLGQARLEFPREPDQLLERLGVGRALAAYWIRQRARYSITPS
jgi:hypothetical protein